MTVKELKDLLKDIPDEYILGRYEVFSVDRVKFRVLEYPIGINNNLKWLALGFGTSIPVTYSQFIDSQDLK